MVNRIGVVLLFLSLCGCASTPPRVEQAPMPDDIASPWFRPTVEPLVPPPSVAVARPASPAEKVALYVPGTVYQATVTPSAPLVVQLHEGEVDPDVIWPPVPLLVAEPSQPTDQPHAAGQSAGVPPWDIQKSKSHPQVYITVKQPGLTLGVAITTKDRTYLLDLKSVAKSPVRLMRWTYDEEVAAMPKKPSLIPDAWTPQQYHTGYRIEPSDPVPVWTPAQNQVIDDGQKTFVIFPTNLQVMEMPMVRQIGRGSPELVNSRLTGPARNILIIDHLVSVGLELRIGNSPTADLVRIYREHSILISCPGDHRCPVWPENTHTALTR